MRRHSRFEWDATKAKANVRKHSVSFAQAMRVLGDELFAALHVEEFDVAHSEQEDRYITTGSDPHARDIVLAIVWTSRRGTTRIISARLATRAERNAYETEIEKKQNRP